MRFFVLAKTQVITWDMKDIHGILQSGSPLYKKYLAETKRNGEKVERSFSITGGRKQVDVDDEHSTTESTVLSGQSGDTSFLNVLMTIQHCQKSLQSKSAILNFCLRVTLTFSSVYATSALIRQYLMIRQVTKIMMPSIVHVEPQLHNTECDSKFIILIRSTK
jgi:hypothetical protein